MEIQPRRQILEIWSSTVEYSYRDGLWSWGGRSGRNSISDADQLLTILFPATAIESLSLASVDQTADDALFYLHALGNTLDIPRRLIGFIDDYLRTYLVDGVPDFSGDSYFAAAEDDQGAITARQRKLHVAESYATSIDLCLATLAFSRVFRQGLRSQRILGQVDELDEYCSQRLTAAMVGLLRCFTVHTFDPSDASGQAMCRMVNQTGVANEVLVHGLLLELAEIRAGLQQEVSVGAVAAAEELENRGRLFECGWSWGVIDGAPEIPYVSGIGRQPEGVAEPRPDLYFTAVALDAIEDLLSERTRILGLLNEEQQRLARSLQLRSDLTRQFWAKIATFGRDGTWPIEDLPWVTSDGRESDYNSVLLTSILVQGIGGERVADVDVERIGRLLEELANRGRITRRPMADDPAISLHLPGMALPLVGSEKVDGGPQLQWVVSAYASLILRRLLRVAGLLDDPTLRIRFLDLADLIWEHIERRRIGSFEARGLWDEPTQVFTDTRYEMYRAPSWYHTGQVVEVLVAAAGAIGSLPVPADVLTQHAMLLLAEAEQLFDQERLRGTSDTGEQMREAFQVVGAKLRRARALIRDRPGTASVLASDVLRDLDMVDAARQDVTRMT